MDVAILAGGQGTRLRGIWDGPKCLAPVFRRKPLLEYLIDSALPLADSIFLLLGHKSEEVIEWLGTYPHKEKVFPIVEPAPLGTAGALRNAVNLGMLSTPCLVLNGDSLPYFRLSEVITGHISIYATAAWWEGKYAGVAVLGAPALAHIQRSKETDLNSFLEDMVHLKVSAGFLDIGTPDGYYDLYYNLLHRINQAQK